VTPEIEAIDVTSGQVTGGGTDTITVNPTSNLAESTAYYVQIDATAFDDTSGNSFAGISDETTWNFTTADESAPTASTLTPADNATDVAVSANVVIEFNETIGTTGTGYVTIFQSSDDSIVEQINTATGAVTGSGSDTITIDPTSDLDNSTSYYIQIDANAFPDNRN